jgi:acyl carrier protein
MARYNFRSSSGLDVLTQRYNMTMDPTTRAIRDFIFQDLVPGENPDEVDDTTSLFTTGLLDSIASLRLVGFLETNFGIRVEPHEVVPENIDTLAALTGFVNSKRSQS